MERERGREREAEGKMGRHKQDDRTGCYCRRCNRLTSQRCHLRNVSSYLLRLSLSIKNRLRVTEEEEAMRAVREQDREQLALVSGEQGEKKERVHKNEKVDVLVKHCIYQA